MPDHIRSCRDNRDVASFLILRPPIAGQDFAKDEEDVFYQLVDALIPPLETAALALNSSRAGSEAHQLQETIEHIKISLQMLACQLRNSSCPV